MAGRRTRSLLEKAGSLVAVPVRRLDFSGCLTAKPKKEGPNTDEERPDCCSLASGQHETESS